MNLTGPEIEGNEDIPQILQVNTNDNGGHQLTYIGYSEMTGNHKSQHIGFQEWSLQYSICHNNKS